MQLSIHFLSKWQDAPFCAFLSFFHESTSQCNEWRSFKIRCRYINPKTKRCAVSFCIEVTNSQGHLTVGSKNSPVGRFVFLCAPLLFRSVWSLWMVTHTVKTVKTPVFPRFFDISVIRPRFREIGFATKVVELEKLHRIVNFPKC